MNTLAWLQTWYQAQCNGDWEHQYGVKIDTLDNPGWSVLIDLIGTKYQDKTMKVLWPQPTETDWIHCRAENGYFMGAGSSQNLEKILEIFRTWIEELSAQETK